MAVGLDPGEIVPLNIPQKAITVVKERPCVATLREHLNND